MLRVLSEFLWSVRRAGLAISTSKTLDAARAIELVGWDDRARLRGALAAVIVERARDRARFEQAFDAFFAVDAAHPGDLFARLRARGFADAELDTLRELLFAAAERSGEAGDAPALRALSGHAGELDGLLAAAGIRRTLRGMTSPSMTGYFAQKTGESIGLPRAANAVARVGRVLVEALGAERGAALAAALKEELDALKRRVRRHVEQELVRRDGDRPDDEQVRRASEAPFAALSEEEEAEVRRAVRRLAERLRGSGKTRARRASRGRVDPRRTAARAARTGGVPLAIVRRRRPRERPKLVVVCDVSESVRSASSFLLELVAAVSELFADARSFVFVSDLAETTTLFRDGPPHRALAAIASGAVVGISANSNYARALGSLERALDGKLDKRTTLVILGDGRTNHHGAGLDVVRRLRERARAVVWLCPESPSSWGVGDSAMARYAETATLVLPARTARELEEAARRLVRLR